MEFFYECRYEARILIPNDVERALLDGGRIPRHPFGCYLMNPGENIDMFLRRFPEAVKALSEADVIHPAIKPVDVYTERQVVNGGWYSRGTVVECGETDISDLLLPLAARIVSQVLWIPYPKNRDLDSDWTDFESNCLGLLIKPKPPSAVETRRIVRNALEAVGIAYKTSRKSKVIGSRP